MDKKHLLLLIAGVALLALPQFSFAGQWTVNDVEPGPDEESDAATPVPDVVDTTTGDDYPEIFRDIWGQSPSGPSVPQIDTLPYLPMSQNLQALLFAIRSSEIGEGVPDEQRYRILYGGASFTDTTDHPALLGWRGGVLPDEWCRAAGYKPGCVSTAAGAYQINKPTWNEFRRDKGDGYGYLGDFSSASQDIAAERILVYTGAADAIDSGDFDRALALASKRWASLPGSDAGQHLQSYDQILAWYQQAGGSVA